MVVATPGTVGDVYRGSSFSLNEANIHEKFMSGDSVLEEVDVTPISNLEKTSIENDLEFWRHPSSALKLRTLTFEHNGVQEEVDIKRFLTNKERDSLLSKITDCLNVVPQATGRSRRFDRKGARRESFESFDSPRSFSSGVNSCDSEDGNQGKIILQDYVQQDSPEARKRKRSKITSPVYGLAQSTRQLCISNDGDVRDFLLQCFKDVQQDHVKTISKAWIKAINPNKQTNHPYAGGPTRAPPWWPPRPPDSVQPTQRNGFVRHREPDHLKKEERNTLVIHIAIMLAKPSADKASPMKGIDITRLEQISYEAIGDKLEGDSNALKLGALRDLFKVLRQLERFNNGEIDATTIIPVSTLRDRSTPKTSSPVSSEDYAFTKFASAGSNNMESTSGCSTIAIGADNITPGPITHTRGVSRPKIRRIHPQSMNEQLSYAHTIGNNSHMPSQGNPIIGVHSDYHTPSIYNQDPFRCSTYPPHSIVINSNPLAYPLNSNQVHNCNGQYPPFGSQHNLPVPQSSFSPLSTSMSMPVTFQHPEMLNEDGLPHGLPLRAELSMADHGHVRQFPQQPQSWQTFMNSDGFGANIMKDNMIKPFKRSL